MKIAPEISHLNPYVPGLPISEVKRRFCVQEVYKLASNENPLGPSPKAVRALSLAAGELARYPDGSCFELKKGLTSYLGVSPEWMTFGNGSDDLVTLLIRAFANPGDQILTGEYFFIAYKIAAQTCRLKTVEAAAQSDFSVSLDELAKNVNSNTRLIFIANPNNPTGHYYNRFEIEKFLEKFQDREDLLIVFDEAYHDFVRASDYETAAEFIQEYSNVVVLRTFSKIFGLAGLRLGGMLARPEITSIINQIRLPFNVNLLAQKAALAAIEDQEHIQKSRELVWSGLDYFYVQLEKMKLPFLKSQGNFVFFDTLADARLVDQELLKQGVILRPLLNYGFRSQMRMSVGLPHENEAAISGLQKILDSLARDV